MAVIVSAKPFVFDLFVNFVHNMQITNHKK